MAKTRQRIFQQKGQVDTQWEMVGSPTPLPSSEVVAEFDTTNSSIDNPSSESYGGASNVGQEYAGGKPVYKQVADPQTQETGVAGPRYDSEIKRAYPDTQ